ncbi:hypothetical protein O9929_06360 [Vibrio lentus]|nr:hypothetical protein [Vibrio lentus]
MNTSGRRKSADGKRCDCRARFIEDAGLETRRRSFFLWRWQLAKAHLPAD